jgi:hypothetical protein
MATAPVGVEMRERHGGEVTSADGVDGAAEQCGWFLDLSHTQDHGVWVRTVRVSCGASVQAMYIRASGWMDGRRTKTAWQTGQTLPSSY